jgi:hypothetical protein
MGPKVRLLERRGVKNSGNTNETLADDFTVRDRTDHGSEWRGENIEPTDLVAVVTKSTDECFAQMARTSGHQDSVVIHFTHDRGRGQ